MSFELDKPYTTSPHERRALLGTDGKGGYGSLTKPDNQKASVEDPSGLTGGNSAHLMMQGKAVDAGSQMVSAGIQGAFQAADNNAARQESRQMADLQRTDDMQQAGVDNKFRTKEVEQQERSFQLKKKKDEFDLRHRRWLDDFKAQLETDKNFMSIVQNIDDTFKRNKAVNSAPRLF